MSKDYIKPCLKCDKPFDAEHQYNRVCPKCSQVNHRIRTPRKSTAAPSNRGNCKVI